MRVIYRTLGCLGLFLAAGLVMAQDSGGGQEELRQPFDWLSAPDRGRGEEEAGPTPGTRTGVLGNVGAILLDPLNYDGASNSEPLTGGGWRALVEQMRLSELPEHEGMFPEPEVIRAYEDAVRDNQHIPLALAVIPFEYLDEDLLLDEELFEIDSDEVLHYIGPDGEEVYLQGDVFAAGVLGENVMATVTAGDAVYFELTQNLIITTPHTSRLADIEVDLGDGNGFRPLHIGTPIMATYATTGIKEVTIRTFLGGAMREANTAITVAPPISWGEPCDLDSDQIDDGWECWDYQSDWITSAFSYDAGSYSAQGNPYLARFVGNRAAEYKYAIFYAYDNPNTTGHPLSRLVNPIIVVDGFDAPGLDLEEKRDPLLIYNVNLNQRTEAVTPPSQRTFLGHELRNEGFDIVVLDYRSALDFIQRNGLALVDLVHRINQANPDPEFEIAAVIGPSMGALVARYALAYMEHHNMQHRVNIYGSFDGVHQGAHMPIGLQQAVLDIAFRSDAIYSVISAMGITRDFVTYVARAPSIRQLVIFNASGSNFRQNAPDEAFMFDPLRTQLYQDLLYLGDYPAQTRNVAVVNGSSRGRRQNKRPGQAVQRMQPGEQLADISFGGRLFGFGRQWRYSFRAAPEFGVTSEVYRMRVYNCSPILNCFFKRTDDRWFVSQSRPLDSAPGGYNNVLMFINNLLNEGQGTVLEGVWPLLKVWFEIAYYHPFGSGPFLGGVVWSDTHSFVSTVSALDYNSTGLSRTAFVNGLMLDQNLDHSIGDDPEHIQRQRTPFDRFFIRTENFDHVDVHDGMILFILQELKPDEYPIPPPQVPAPAGLALYNLGEDFENPHLYWTASAQPGATHEVYRTGTHPNEGTATWDVVHTTSASEWTDMAVVMDPNGPFHWYRVRAVYDDMEPSDYTNTITTDSGGLGTSPDSADAPDDSGAVAAHPGEVPLPEVFVVHPPFPNPTSSSVDLRFEMPEPERVRIVVYDLLGRYRGTLLDNTREAGYWSATVDLSDVPAGVYVIVVLAGENRVPLTVTNIK